MGNIINFHNSPIVDIKKQLLEKEKELEAVKAELIFFKKMYSQTCSVNDMLKLEIADLNSSIVILEGHLKLIQENLKKLQKRLENVDRQRSQVQIFNPKKDE